jgi:NAD(P)H-hydrate repair Nnr-like enzyme with NAD(P)H-hydrate dehydratase domain
MVTWMQTSLLRGEEEDVFYTAHRAEFKRWFSTEIDNEE